MCKNKDALRKELIRDILDAKRKREAAQRELANDPVWQEMQKWVTIDWNDGRETLLKNGVTVSNILGVEEWTLDVQDHCFVQNFPSLKVKDAHLTDCIFVNCGQIKLEDGTAVRCVFAETDTIFLDAVTVTDSVFRDLSCDHGGFIVSLEDSVISGCRFADITLYNDNYLADGAGDCLIEKCRFKAICTDREDKELFTCSETTGTIIRRKEAYDMVDRDSCEGLDEVENPSGVVFIGSFETYIDEEDDDE